MADLRQGDGRAQNRSRSPQRDQYWEGHDPFPAREYLSKGKGEKLEKGKAKGDRARDKGKGRGKSGREMQGTARGYKHGVKAAELWPRFLQHRCDNHGESEA